jgi:hypothetical protein
MKTRLTLTTLSLFGSLVLYGCNHLAGDTSLNPPPPVTFSEYVREDHNTQQNLDVFSFTRQMDDYDLSSGEPLELTWQLPDGVTEPIQVYGRGFPDRLSSYEMSAQVAPESRFLYPINGLAEHGITHDKLGVTSQIRAPVKEWFGGQVAPYVFVAPIIRQRGQGDASPHTGETRYQLKVVSGLPLRGLYVSMWDARNSRQETTVYSNENEEALLDSYAMTGDGLSLDFVVPESMIPEYYLLEVTGNISNNISKGVAIISHVWFYHAGN